MNGQQASGVNEGETVDDYVVFGGLHDGGTAEGFDFAAKGDFAAWFELAGEEGVAEPDDGEVSRFVADYSPGGGLALFAQSNLGGFPDDGEYSCVLPDFQVGNLGAAGVVFMVAGEVVEEVPDSVNVEPGQLFGGFGIDAIKVGNGFVEGFRIGRRRLLGGEGFRAVERLREAEAVADLGFVGCGRSPGESNRSRQVETHWARWAGVIRE